ncbi:class I SAM-dependent methyltransferase [Streptomyces caatingaensis]|uniref:Methyltransferase type 11 n=1 Tax=Streptomyces caatingaensis TaxID=1678637 RepID=A0A0K9XBM1_9ACTN|nr:class I SAM-dependent methyltransferase [Streptomyces caatingaensis]KNB50608.1 methyltransferase type 11 [Streptomyces caatingaensis]
MAMNRYHRFFCRSRRWARTVEDEVLPWTLSGVQLGSDALEIGPGPGVTTRVLLDRVRNLCVAETDRSAIEGLCRRFGHRTEILHADAANLPVSAGRFDSVACFTMLHHVPSRERQDRLFAEAFRVLRPGGVFVGCDAVDGLRFRLLHLGDTCVPVPPDTLAGRLRAAGFDEAQVSVREGRFRFRAYRR